jgi:hypothetical protein
VTRTTFQVLATIAVLGLSGLASPDARAQGSKPAPWQPKAGTSAPATSAAAGRTVDAPEGVVRPIAPLYQPSVADSVLPFHPVYRELVPDQQLTLHHGALRQGSPERRYYGLGAGQAASVAVDGGNGGSHLAIVVMLPWIDRVAPSVACPADLEFRVDGGDAHSSTLWFTPGPVLTGAGRAPLAVSTPGLVTVPLAPGRHTVEFRFKNTPATYVLFQVGAPEVMPLPVMPGG